MKWTYALFPAFFVVILFVACGKNNDAPVSPPNRPDTPDNKPSGLDSLNWTKIVDSVKGSEISDIWFTDSQHGFLAAVDKNLYSSSDGGSTWKQMTGTTNTSIFQNIYFLNSQNGYALSHTALAWTSNGGNSWTLKPLSIPFTEGHYGSLQFVTPVTGFIATGSAAFKTTDAGTNWQKIRPGVTSALYFRDEMNGWAFSAPDSMCITTDGGEHWQLLAHLPIKPAAFNDIYDVLQFTDDLHGWLMTPVSLSVTTDGGMNWTTTRTAGGTGNAAFIDLQMLSNQLGYLASTDEILKTEDGGVSWQRSYKRSNIYLNCLFFLNEHDGWAGGYHSSVLKYHH